MKKYILGLFVLVLIFSFGSGVKKVSAVVSCTSSGQCPAGQYCHGGTGTNAEGFCDTVAFSGNVSVGVEEAVRINIPSQGVGNVTILVNGSGSKVYPVQKDSTGSYVLISGVPAKATLTLKAAGFSNTTVITPMSFGSVTAERVASTPVIPIPATVTPIPAKVSGFKEYITNFFNAIFGIKPQATVTTEQVAQLQQQLATLQAQQAIPESRGGEPASPASTCASPTNCGNVLINQWIYPYGTATNVIGYSNQDFTYTENFPGSPESFSLKRSSYSDTNNKKTFQVTPGSYTITQQVLTAYSLDPASYCVVGNQVLKPTAGSPLSFSVANGQTVTCSFFNRSKSSIGDPVKVDKTAPLQR